MVTSEGDWLPISVAYEPPSPAKEGEGPYNIIAAMRLMHV
jgi:hypothetical protein